MMNIKNIVKSILKPNGLGYLVASKVYNIFSGRAWQNWKKNWKEEKFRKQCYKAFDKDRMVKITNYGIECYFEAISPKNYWHLSIRNNENHGYFGRFLKVGDTVLDVGGHVGAWTMFYAKFVGKDGFVYVFEPEKEGFNAIKRNISINNLQEVTQPIQAGISDKTEKIKFYVRPDKDTHSIFEETHAKSPLGIQYEYDVDIHTIDSLVANGTIRQPDFIKIDVEGAELKVLEGMRNTARKTRAVYVECHLALKVDLGLGEPVELVSSKLKDLGAKCILQLDSEHLVGLFAMEPVAPITDETVIYSSW